MRLGPLVTKEKPAPAMGEGFGVSPWPVLLQLHRYPGLLMGLFVPAQQGALFSVLKIFGAGC